MLSDETQVEHAFFSSAYNKGSGCWFTMTSCKSLSQFTPEFPELNSEEFNPDSNTMVKTSSEITWLSVHYFERDDARAQGARWDPHKRLWYAPPYTDLTPLQKYSLDRPRVYLECPIEEKDEAKRLGALWDASNGNCKWFIFETMERTPFERWLP